ncbi:hypothetical protein TSUD_125850 [Trifolium subterraneum]|uniref:Uncharacterized protein n=1 Tax=Trifolium subterraneum TaxID=3900 RepID=A0A2Z6N7P9_TRISU|nr:hypothetical protein TSUD_125850 [Trifolium subterraneum]
MKWREDDDGERWRERNQEKLMKKGDGWREEDVERWSETDGESDKWRENNGERQMQKMKPLTLT